MEMRNQYRRRGKDSPQRAERARRKRSKPNAETQRTQRFAEERRKKGIHHRGHREHGERKDGKEKDGKGRKRTEKDGEGRKRTEKDGKGFTTEIAEDHRGNGESRECWTADRGTLGGWEILLWIWSWHGGWSVLRRKLPCRVRKKCGSCREMVTLG
jgi:hypothetical protein